MGKHEEDKCFYNKKYKGWRPRKICKELGIKFKRRHEYSSDMGRFASIASEGAAAAAKVTVVKPAMNDGVGARKMTNGLRYGERKLTNP